MEKLTEKEELQIKMCKSILETLKKNVDMEPVDKRAFILSVLISCFMAYAWEITPKDKLRIFYSEIIEIIKGKVDEMVKEKERD